jgi:hypothetical protein
VEVPRLPKLAVHVPATRLSDHVYLLTTFKEVVFSKATVTACGRVAKNFFQALIPSRHTRSHALLPAIFARSASIEARYTAVSGVQIARGQFDAEQSNLISRKNAAARRR